MARKSSAIGKSQAVRGIAGDSIGGLFDVVEVESLVQAAARAGNSLSYSEALMALGYRFTRPKMRELCKVLGRVDDRAATRGEPELAVLVVRESDKLPGQGWWVSRSAAGTRYKGPWEGPEAAAYIQKIQAKAFRHWRNRD
jgi:hypothetical protein